MRVRVLTPVLAISILIISACTKDESAVRMPVTTDSELALQLYETGLVAFDQLKWDMAWQNFEYAIREDSDFFMAHFWMYFLTSKKSKKIAEKAFQADVELNDGEELIKSSLKYLVDGQDEKVVESLKKVVDLYPEDPHVHKILYIMQLQYMKDAEGAIESMEQLIEVLKYCPIIPRYITIWATPIWIWRIMKVPRNLLITTSGLHPQRPIPTIPKATFT